MKIIVCIKQVPDTAARIVVENGKVNWGDAQLVMNPWDEYAVEAALLFTEAHGGSVTLVSMGSESALDALKQGLAMGATDAILINDPALAGSDSLATAQVLAAAVRKLGGADLVLFGKQAVDSDGGITAAQTARLLDFPILSLVSAVKAIDPGAGTIQVERSIEEGRQSVTSKFPAVMTFVKDFGEPRYPSFMGIRKASRAQIPTWTLADLGIPAPQSVVHWPELSNPPVRDVVCEIVSGGSPAEIAASLADKIMAEKVI